MKRKDRIEVIAMIGVFGTLVSASEMYPIFFVRNKLKRTYICLYLISIAPKELLFP